MRIVPAEMEGQPGCGQEEWQRAGHSRGCGHGCAL